MKKIVVIIMALLTLCSAAILPVSACAEGTDSEYDLSASGELIKTVGRTLTNEKGIYVAWSNSGNSFKGVFQGKVQLELYSSTNYTNIAVAIDGVYSRMNRFAIYSGTNTYTIADVESGEHTIEVFKLNEAAWGYLIFSKLWVNGKLTEKPEEKPLQIEIIGDSLTCGFGIYPSGGKKDYPVMPGKSYEEEDSFYTYAGLTARRLNADASFVSLSGWGVTQGGDGDPMNYIPRIYKQTCGVSADPLLEDWDFSSHQVDLVICSLGTNDWKMWSEGGEKVLKEGIVNFCKTIRSCYPNAKIVWCYGLMHSLMEETIRSAVESVNDSDLYYFSMPTNTAGGADHADYWGHDAAAEQLLRDLRSIGIQ